MSMIIVSNLKSLCLRFYYRKIKKTFVTILLLKPVAKASSKVVDRIVREKKCDCIVVMGTFACRTIAYNSSNIPIVWVNDCVISQNYDYYWHNVDKHIISEYNYIQQRVFNNSSAIVLSSNCAKNGAINDYNVDPEKNSVFLMGANIEVDEIKKRTT